MIESLKTAYKTPIMSKIICLDDYVWNNSTKPEKRVQYLIVNQMLDKIGHLHEYALKELRGNLTQTNIKRIEELLIEIQSGAYRVYNRHGWTLQTTSVIDSYCDEIYEQITKYHYSNIKSAKPIKFTDEDGSA